MQTGVGACDNGRMKVAAKTQLCDTDLHDHDHDLGVSLVTRTATETVICHGEPPDAVWLFCFVSETLHGFPRLSTSTPRWVTFAWRHLDRCDGNPMR